MERKSFFKNLIESKKRKEKKRTQEKKEGATKEH